MSKTLANLLWQKIETRAIVIEHRSPSNYGTKKHIWIWTPSIWQRRIFSDTIAHVCKYFLCRYCVYLYPLLLYYILHHTACGINERIYVSTWSTIWFHAVHSHNIIFTCCSENNRLFSTTTTSIYLISTDARESSTSVLGTFSRTNCRWWKIVDFIQSAIR